jgi:rhodanese-related sulfurtransferase
MSIPIMTPEAAHEALSVLRILDVREPSEIEGPLGAIPGAENVPLRDLAGHVLGGDEPMLLVCRSGKRSERACEILMERGFSKVTNLDGGMIAWNRACLPVVRRELETLDAIVESLMTWLAQVTGSTGAEARSRIDGWIAELDESSTSPTPALLDHALTRLSECLIESGPPADLDLTITAYRRDLSMLST